MRSIVRETDAAWRIAAHQRRPKKPLRLADRMVAVVVEHEELDRQAGDGTIVCSSWRFIWMLPSPARHTTRLPPRAPRSADGRRQIEAHRRRTRIAEQPLPALDRQGLERHDAGRGVAAHHDLPFGQMLPQSFDKTVRIDQIAAVPVLGQHDRDTAHRAAGTTATQSVMRRQRLAAKATSRACRKSATSARMGRSGVIVGFRSSSGSMSTTILKAARANACQL